MPEKIMLNHVGFCPHAAKKVIYQGEEKIFTVNRMQDNVFTPVFEGKFDEGNTDLLDAKRGDFTTLIEQGIYRISIGSQNSRCFIVHANVYDTVQRMLSYFFTWQRCCDDLGWNGRCHTGDSLTLKNGSRRSLTGGHHQSGDLRKWAWGTSIGLIGYTEYALETSPVWDKGIIEEELRHGLAYYLSLITDEGFLIDCTWIPEGYDETKMIGKGVQDYRLFWNNRIYFESPAPEPAHWNAIRFLALASRYFKDRDKAFAGTCLAGARKIWDYLETHSLRDYELPIYPPLGHGGMHRWYLGFYPDSALHYGSRAMAAAELFRATADEYYHLVAVESLRRVGELRLSGTGEGSAGCFREGPGSKRLANEYVYFYSTTIPQSFVSAMELWPGDKDAFFWRENALAIGDQLLISGKQNPFQRVSGTWYTSGHEVYAATGIGGHSSPQGKFQTGSFPESGESVMADYFNFCYNLDLIANARFLIKAASCTGKPEYRAFAQDQIDWVMGVNPWDASNIEGVGYNQPHRGIFGEFFPPVPQIPGAVYTGLTEQSFNPSSYGLDNEYDMPMVGWLMPLLTEING
ncbi:MAG: glycoside hydrolase family 9 protein [Treponema sp.]|jgi:hypothetical protein|nr:glycoside hydrolase family 9 protein [Treponema sp.]